MRPTIAAWQVRLPAPQNLGRRLLGLVFGIAIGLIAAPASAWFWEAPTWQSINSSLVDDYPQVTHVSTQDLERRLSDNTRPTPLVIDARALEEYETSHIAGAVHAETVEQVRALLKKQAPGIDVFVYCSVGVRSARLVAKLQADGVQRAVNLRGSIFEWANRGLPVYKGEQRTTGVHPFNTKWGELLERQYWSHEP